MITVIAGTNRAGSNSLKIAELLVELYEQAGEEATLLDFTQLPASIFTPTVYKDKPEEFTKAFVDPILAADGLHVVVPEYNGSFPGILKHVIDLLPFPEAFEGRPTAYLGLAAGMFGALRAVEQLQMVFGYRNAMNYPKRVFLPAVYKNFDESGKFSDDELRGRIAGQVSGFLEFVGKVKA